MRGTTTVHMSNTFNFPLQCEESVTGKPLFVQKLEMERGLLHHIQPDTENSHVLCLREGGKRPSMIVSGIGIE
jgi:hypothetical protein